MFNRHIYERYEQLIEAEQRKEREFANFMGRHRRLCGFRQRKGRKRPRSTRRE
jgi:hypothetical protein